MPSSNAPAATETPKTGEVVTPRLADKFHAYMRDRAEVTLNDGDGSDITAGQVERILAAESEDDIWNADAAGTIQMRDAIGLEVEVHDMRPVSSDRFSEGHGYFISCNVTVLGGPAELLARLGVTVGSNAVLQTGADLIVSKIRAFEARNLLPVKGVITGTETRSGYQVLRFGKLPVRAQ